MPIGQSPCVQRDILQEFFSVNWYKVSIEFHLCLSALMSAHNWMDQGCRNAKDLSTNSKFLMLAILSQMLNLRRFFYWLNPETDLSQRNGPHLNKTIENLRLRERLKECPSFIVMYDTSMLENAKSSNQLSQFPFEIDSCYRNVNTVNVQKYKIAVSKQGLS